MPQIPPITVYDGSELYPPMPRQSKRCPRRKKVAAFGLLVLLWMAVSAPQVVVTSDGHQFEKGGPQVIVDDDGFRYPVLLWLPGSLLVL